MSAAAEIERERERMESETSRLGHSPTSTWPTVLKGQLPPGRWRIPRPPQVKFNPPLPSSSSCQVPSPPPLPSSTPSVSSTHRVLLPSLSRGIQYTLDGRTRRRKDCSIEGGGKRGECFFLSPHVCPAAQNRKLLRDELRGEGKEEEFLPWTWGGGGGLKASARVVKRGARIFFRSKKGSCFECEKDMDIGHVCRKVPVDIRQK